jgi:hypothetical protein
MMQCTPAGHGDLVWYHPEEDMWIHSETERAWSSSWSWWWSFPAYRRKDWLADSVHTCLKSVEDAYRSRAVTAERTAGVAGGGNISVLLKIRMKTLQLTLTSVDMTKCRMICGSKDRRRVWRNVPSIWTSPDARTNRLHVASSKVYQA